MQQNTDPDDECTPAPGSCQTGVCNGAGACGRVANGDVCRASTGACDVEERCTLDACPPDALAPATEVCRPANGACDVEERCTGTTAQCPADTLRPAATLCRPAAGDCDVEERCDGTDAACPSDGLVAASTVCRVARGVCDVAETCSGSSPTCPSDARVPAGQQCRASVGPCDQQELCTGSSDTCPADGFAATTVVCRAAAGACDAIEYCTGSSTTCPTDAKLTSVCRAAAGTCDRAETCDGVSNACPTDAFEPSSSEVCTPYRCTGASTACTSGACLNDASCNRGAYCRGGVCVKGKRVFVTSVGVTGNFGGLSGGDALCTARANAAGLSGTFKAWLSTSTVSASSRFTQATVPYYRRSGTTVTVLAQNFAQLVAGVATIPGAINVDENGATVNANVWTATSVSGASSVPSCADWTSTTASSGGRQGVTQPQSPDWNWWTDQGTGPCSVANRLYCFEQ